MDKVMIVDGDQKNLNRYKEGLEKLHQFKVLTATDGEEALTVLKREPVSVLVTEIDVPKRDGIELLAYMTRNYPSTPCVVMTTYGKPWFKKKMDQQAVLYHIEKPFELPALVSAIFVCLNLKDEGIALKGISMSSFLPLIELDAKTCRLEVKRSGKGKGYLYFEDGVLFDAHYRDLTGEKAAQEMVSWEKIEINFTDLPRRRSKKRVRTGLMDLAGATWLREECDLAAGQNVNQSMTGGESNLLDPEETDAEAGTLNKETFSVPLQSFIKLLRAIKGYKAVGITNAHGTVLAYDAIDEDIDVSSLCAAFNKAFTLPNEAAIQNGFDECHHCTIHTKRGIILISRSGVNAKSHFQVIGVIASDGNWHFMKIQLENMISKISL